jgi:hypothetical protein
MNNSLTLSSAKPSIWGRPVLLNTLTIVFGSLIWRGVAQLDPPQGWEWPLKFISLGVGVLVAMLVMTVFRLQR